jgi:hypothetical protein
MGQKWRLRVDTPQRICAAAVVPAAKSRLLKIFHPRKRRKENFAARLERFPITLNREALQFYRFGRIFFGKPVSTFPENAVNPADYFGASFGSSRTASLKSAAARSLSPLAL